MTVAEAKEYLHQSYLLARGIHFKRSRIEQLRELAGYSAPAFSSERVNTSTRHGKLENILCQIDEWEREIDDAFGKIREIEKQISKVDNLDYRDLLELRYVDGYSWKTVAEKMRYTERHIYNLHSCALKHFSKLQ